MVRLIFRRKQLVIRTPTPRRKLYQLELLTVSWEVYDYAEFYTMEEMRANVFVCKSAAFLWGSRATGPNRTVLTQFAGGRVCVISTNILKVNLDFENPL